MSAVAIALISFGAILISIAAGVLGRLKLPEEHLSGDSKEVIRLATALIGTMAALVLALLFASTRGSFEATYSSVANMTTHIIELDHTLRQYGPEGEALRGALRRDVDAIVESVWTDDPTVRGLPKPYTPVTQEVTVLSQLRILKPATPLQAALQARAVSVSNELERLRLNMLAHPPDSISRPFGTVLLLWLCFIFASFSMSAKANPTLIIVLVVCAFSASSAIYLILELGQPFDGLLQIPNEALRNALPPLPKS